jgi:hypothetical protein
MISAMEQMTTRAIPDSHRMPAGATALKPLILKVLSQGPLRRGDLFLKLKLLTSAAGYNFDQARQGLWATKKALAALRDEGRIFSPQPKYWQIADPEMQADAMGDEDDDDEELLEQDARNENKPYEDTIEEANEVGITPSLKIGRIIGNGPESIYVYYHDAHAELANRDGSTVWECKVGSTTGEPDARIIGQGALTCFPRPPIIGLVIRTHHRRSLERLLHSALTLAGRRIEGGGGSEWFRTSPVHVERWYMAYLATISILGDEGEMQAKADPEQSRAQTGSSDLLTD